MGSSQREALVKACSWLHFCNHLQAIEGSRWAPMGPVLLMNGAQP